jgi:hypothetical protein
VLNTLSTPSTYKFEPRSDHVYFGTEYDAIYTWNASTVYPEPFCDNCAAYIDDGGGVIVGAIATNTGTYGMLLTPWYTFVVRSSDSTSSQ